MSVPVSQMWTVASYVIRQKLAGRKQYPLVLMLEPLFRCNLACAGCGKIQYPAHILKRQLTPDECFNAVDECGAPVVSIPGGEPLMHPEIDKIVEGLVARKKYIYLCTNALLLKEKIHLFKPTKYLTFSVHLDGQREHHDFAVCREGGYDIAVDAVREALQRGFNGNVVPTLAADGKIVVLALAVQMNAECEIFRGLEELNLLFQQQSIRAQINIFLARDQALDNLVDLGMHQRLAAWD